MNVCIAKNNLIRDEAHGFVIELEDITPLKLGLCIAPACDRTFVCPKTKGEKGNGEQAA